MSDTNMDIETHPVFYMALCLAMRSKYTTDFPLLL